MKTVYLDQNKWIDLARARFRQDADQLLKRTLTTVLDASESGDWAFPISSTHYIEIARIGNRRRRVQLGEVMWDVSRGRTIASYSAMVRHELDRALSARFSGITVRPFELLGQGVSHAFGMDRPDYRIPAFLRPTVSSRLAAGFEAAAQETMERSVLTGQGPDGIEAPTVGHTVHNERFMRHLNDLPSTLSGLPREKWHDALVSMSLADILEPVNEALAFHELDLGQLLGQGVAELSTFVHELPTRAIDLHMHWQIAKNPSLQPKPTDLEDWGALVPAAAYCDFLVCEKHFADLVARDGFRVHAEVLTDVRELMPVLAS